VETEPGPERLQFTAVLLSPETCAANCTELPAVMLGFEGERLMLATGETVTDAFALSEVLATLVAVTVTVDAELKVDGEV
jgi:hypothetical protein